MSKIVWISGNLHERQSLLQKIKEKHIDSDIVTLTGDFTYSYFEQVVRSKSCFGEKRVIITTECPEHSGSKDTMFKHMIKLFPRISEDTLLVFYGIDPKKERALFGHVQKHGKVFKFETEMHVDKACSWLTDYFKEHKKTISLADARSLVVNNGMHPINFTVEIDQLRLAARKLIDYIGEKKTATADDVIVNAYGTPEVIVWHIFEHLHRRDLVSALTVLNKLVEDGDVIGGVTRMLYTLNGQYKGLLLLKEMLTQKKSKSEAAIEMSNFYRYSSTGNNGKMSMTCEVVESGENKGRPVPAYSDMFVKTALYGSYSNKPIVDLYSRRDLYKIVNSTEDCLSQILRRKTEAEALMLVDLVFYTICNSVDDVLINNLRKFDA